MNDLPFGMNTLIDTSNRTLAAISGVDAVRIFFSLSRSRVLDVSGAGNDVRTTVTTFPTIGLRLTSNSVCGRPNGIIGVDNIVSTASNSVSLVTRFTGPRGLLGDNNTNSVIIPGSRGDTVIVPRRTYSRVRSGVFICVMAGSGGIGCSRVGMGPRSSNGGCVMASNLRMNSHVMLGNVAGLASNRRVGPVALRHCGRGVTRTTGLTRSRSGTRTFTATVNKGGWCVVECGRG